MAIRNYTGFSTRSSNGLEPAADNNVEAVSRCCLDVNTRRADFAKGRFGLVWWSVWAILATLVFLIGLPVLGNVAGGRAATQGISFADNSFGVVVLCSSFMVVLIGNVYFWVTSYPLRFNRVTRKVYFYRRGRLNAQDWRNVSAYLAEVPQPSAKGRQYIESQLRIEFPRPDGRPICAQVLGTDGAGSSYGKVGSLWEFIRVFMEEGPEALPQPARGIGKEWGWRQWIKHHSPFPVFPRKSFFSVIIQPIVFPVRAALFVLNAPTDIVYSRIATWASGVPYPRPLVDACRCQETREEAGARVAALLESYGRKIQQNVENIIEIENTLIEEYRKVVVAPCYPNGEDESVIPEGWYRVRLSDLVEINPTYNVGSGKEVVFVPLDALATEGPLVNRDKLERCVTPPSSIMFRDGDSLFPFQRPALEKQQSAYVDFVADMGLDTEFGCVSHDMVVLRGSKLSPELTYCLSKDKRLSDWATKIIKGEHGVAGDKFDAFCAFTLPMPKPHVLDKFQTQVAAPKFEKILELSQENERLKRSRGRVLANTGGIEYEKVVSEIPSAGNAS